MSKRKTIHFGKVPETRLDIPFGGTERGELVDIKEVHDGDTASCTDGRKIRFFGIDAPELGQTWGINARDYLTTLFNHYRGQIRLKLNGAKSYDRLIGNFYVGDTDIDVSLEMIKSGNAHAYRLYLTNTPEESVYIQAEEAAKAAKVGLWSQPNVVNPAVYRHTKRTKSSPSTRTVPVANECLIL